MAVARPDLFVTMTGVRLRFDVAWNDDDVVGISYMSPPLNGTIQALGGTTYLYTPNPGFAGVEDMTYTGVNTAGGIVPGALFQIKVLEPNVQPIARDATFTCAADGAITVLSDYVTDANGDPLAIARLDAPRNGTLTKSGTFGLSYVPEAGFVGADRFGYVVSDGGDVQAQGIVNMNVVAYVNAAPVATDFSASIPHNTPTILTPRTHCTDADGDVLSIVIDTPPTHGFLTLFPADQSYEYEPDSGYSGTDSFTFKAFDGQALSNAATVTLTVAAAPGGTGYANGFQAYRRIGIAKQAAAGAAAETDMVFTLAGTYPRLKHTSNGGLVQSTNGWDIRVELEDGTKLDSDLELYNPATGQILIHWRVPSWAPSADAFVRLYYGKSVTATEHNPAGCWQKYLARINCRTGIDSTGNGRNLTVAGTISAGTLMGDAGSFPGSAVATLAYVAWLDGLGAITVQSLIKPGSTTVNSNRGWVTQGPVTTTSPDAAQGLILQYLAAPSTGVAQVVHFKIKLTDGDTYTFSAASKHTSNTQCVHGTWKQGEAPKMYLEGDVQTPATVGVVRSGTTKMAGGNSLYLGRGARDAATGGWVGLVDELRFGAFQVSAIRAKTEALNFSDQALVLTVSAENLYTDAADTEAPLALPFYGSVASALEIDFDVLTRAVVPSGTAETLTSITAPSHGDGTYTGTKYRYQPVSMYVGADRATYTVTRGGKTSTGQVMITVNGPAANRPAVAWRYDLYPFKRRAVHWRGIGDGCQSDTEMGVPKSVDIRDWENNKLTTLTGGSTKKVWEDDLRPTIGFFELGASDQGRKGIFDCKSTDTNAAGHATNLQEFWEFEYRNPGEQIWFTGVKQTRRVPRGTTSRPSTAGVYYPAAKVQGGDNTYMFGPRNGGSVQVYDMYTDFALIDGTTKGSDGVVFLSSNKVHAVTGVSLPPVGTMIYTDANSYNLDWETDTQEISGYYKSAARLRWPGTVLRGHDINDADPDPIRHALNAAATRHWNVWLGDQPTPKPAPSTWPLSMMIMGHGIVWPAGGVDASCKQYWTGNPSVNSSSRCNEGWAPYGGCLRIRYSDLAAVLTSIGTSNKRGRRIAECLCRFGIYLVDGHGQYKIIDGKPRGGLQIRVDHLVGRNANGGDLSGVVSDVNAALAKCIPYLYPVGNQHTWTSKGTLQNDMLNTDGFHYLGGGGALDSLNPHLSRGGPGASGYPFA